MANERSELSKMVMRSSSVNRKWGQKMINCTANCHFQRKYAEITIMKYTCHQRMTGPSQAFSVSWLTFILVFDSDLVVTLQLSPEDTLHHEHQLIIGNVFIMDGNASDVVTQLGFDDQLPAQVQLAVHGAVWPLLLPALDKGRREVFTLSVQPWTLLGITQQGVTHSHTEHWPLFNLPAP